MILDELISMHKAVTNVIEELASIDPADDGDVTVALAVLRSSVRTVATVQRDILAGALGMRR